MACLTAAKGGHTDKENVKKGKKRLELPARLGWIWQLLESL
jgi:hypothetical protein